METETSELNASENQLDAPYNSVEDIGTTHLTRAAFFKAVYRELDAVEHAFLDLMRQGEKAQTQYTAILGQHGQLHDADKDVKNTKERLQRKLRTLAKKWGYKDEDLLGM